MMQTEIKTSIKDNEKENQHNTQDVQRDVILLKLKKKKWCNGKKKTGLIFFLKRAPEN